MSKELNAVSQRGGLSSDDTRRFRLHVLSVYVSGAVAWTTGGRVWSAASNAAWQAAGMQQDTWQGLLHGYCI